MKTTIPTAPLGVLRTKRIRAAHRTTLTMTFEDRDTTALRDACTKLRPEDGREPSLSLVGRRALHVYLAALARCDDDGIASEIATIKRMTAPPSDATRDRLKKARGASR